MGININLALQDPNFLLRHSKDYISFHSYVNTYLRYKNYDIKTNVDIKTTCYTLHTRESRIQKDKIYQIDFLQSH